MSSAAAAAPHATALAPAARLDALFAALGDGTRRAIVARLARGEATVQELAAPFKISLPAISKHLKVLARAGLIVQGREAQRRPCRLRAEALGDVTAWAEATRRTWEERLDRLEAFLAETPPAAGPAHSAPRPSSRPRRTPTHSP